MPKKKKKKTNHKQNTFVVNSGPCQTYQVSVCGLQLCEDSSGELLAGATLEGSGRFSVTRVNLKPGAFQNHGGTVAAGHLDVIYL